MWTKSKARLKQLRQDTNTFYNWLFLPSDPGLSSESLCLKQCLKGLDFELINALSHWIIPAIFNTK